jgi:hypothetical protein
VPAPQWIVRGLAYTKLPELAVVIAIRTLRRSRGGCNLT